MSLPTYYVYVIGGVLALFALNALVARAEAAARKRREAEFKRWMPEPPTHEDILIATARKRYLRDGDVEKFEAAVEAALVAEEPEPPVEEAYVSVWKRRPVRGYHQRQETHYEALDRARARR